MRGFALAAAANQRGVGDAFGSLLLALRSLPEAASQKTPTNGEGSQSKKHEASAGPHVMSFGTILSEQPSLDAVVESALGRQDSPAVAPQLPVSLDCSPATRWNGATVSRTRIDRFFSQASTCLDQVFEDILADGKDKLNIVLTDAEQNAPLNDRGCPNARNLGTIQSYLNKWSAEGRFAAVIAATLPYQPWLSEKVASYCGCEQRLIFMYVLAPSADAAEQVFHHVSDYWKIEGSAPSYLPLVPRPAVSYTVRIVTAALESGAPLVFSSDAKAMDLEPAEGRLPQVSIQLNANEGFVAFNTEKAGFVSANLGNSSAIDWSQAALEWSDPIPLESDGRLRRENKSASLSLIRVKEPLGNETNPAPANVRLARFLGQTSEPEREVKPSGVAPLRLRIRRTTGEKGCQWYLVEVRAPARQHVTQVLGTLSGLSSTTCLNWDAVRDQVNSVFQTGSSMRFLLHVDY
jgi:hypothetical protein